MTEKIEAYCKICKKKEILTQKEMDKAKQIGMVICDRCGMPKVLKRLKEK